MATVPRAAEQMSARQGSAVANPVATAALGPADYKAVVDKYCVTCHDDRARTGDLSLQDLNFTNVPADSERFEKVVRKLGVGAMPPQGMPRPDKGTHDALVTWIAGELDRAAAASPS